MYHGWEDTALSADNAIRYFEATRTKLGAKASLARLFMIPGQAHCIGGSGSIVVDLIGALDKWVDGGTPPERLKSSKHESFIAALTGQPTNLLQTRPVCPWPKTPH